jgi:hypothetical protein
VILDPELRAQLIWDDLTESEQARVEEIYEAGADSWADAVEEVIGES